MTQSGTTRRLGFVCFGLLAGLLIAGLWPFNFFPRNRVSWLQNQNGLHFDRYGEIYSPALWSPRAAGSEEGFSIELWLRGETNYRTYSPFVIIGDPLHTDNFVIAQSLSDLVVQGRFRDNSNPVGVAKLWMNGACRQGRPRFLTITSGAQGTTVYLEGAVVNAYPNLTLTANNFSGRLLLGHAPEGQEAWSGDLLGLAFYPRTLAPSEVSEHYQAWRESRTAELVKSGAAVYPFDEHAGHVAHDRANTMPDLVIPERFRVLHDTPLEVPAKPSLSDLQDAVVNILGFVPFGFLLAVYFQKAADYSRGRALLITIVFGVVTSVVIELLQVYLPSRDSSLLDVINNSVGTALGALIPPSIIRWKSFL